MDSEFIRKQFPSLRNSTIFMDNAGGAQVVGKVIDKISEYLIKYNVQHGATYELSQKATKTLEMVHVKLSELINASDPREIVMGSSSTMLFRILSLCLSKQWSAGDEVIITNSEHESNASCWTDLADKGIVVKVWKVNPKSYELDIDDLKKLLTPQTKLVTMTHVSNILGTINPIKEIGKVVHNNGSLFCVDGVAYAPHRHIDVKEWDVDFYVYSCYKVFAPHCGLLYGKLDLLLEMDGINHYFIDKSVVPYKLQPGNYNYELVYSLLGFVEYLEDCFEHHFSDDLPLSPFKKYQRVFELFSTYEEILTKYLINFLQSIPDVVLIGSPNSSKNLRVSTVSFVHRKVKSSEIVKELDSHNIGVRCGDFYAKKIIEDLDLVQYNGVVRVSLVHYNTLEEVKKLERILKEFCKL